MGDTTKNLGDPSINRSKHWELLQIVVYNVLLLQTSGQSTWKLCNLTWFTQSETNYKIGLQVTRVNSCRVFDRSRQWSEQELSVSWSSISKDTAEGSAGSSDDAWRFGSCSPMEHWSMDRIQRFPPTQKLYGFGCYGVSNLGIYNFGVSRDTHFISVYKLAANVTSKLLRPRCVTQIGQQLRSGWHHIFTILTVLYWPCQPYVASNSLESVPLIKHDQWIGWLRVPKVTNTQCWWKKAEDFPMNLSSESQWFMVNTCRCCINNHKAISYFSGINKAWQWNISHL